MQDLNFWFITGSQHLYGEKTLEEVAAHSKEMVDFLNNAEAVKPYSIIFTPVVTSQEDILNTLLKSEGDKNCAGIITWMHTFSPSKMWINGLKIFNKPVLHLHTQFNEEIPWDKIDMDFMNTNQSAHGDREHGYIFTRMGIKRKVIVGYYKDEDVLKKIGRWLNVAATVYLGKDLKIMRLGDNMREVAVTEGDKVEAQIKFGWNVNYYGVGDFAKKVNEILEEEIDKIIEEYKEKYMISDEILNDHKKMYSIRYQARMEIALLKMLEEGGFSGFTDTFEDLYGLEQLPGLATQRIMEKGYGFGPEGDWKGAAMLRTLKMIAKNRGTSIMEDYTYNFEKGNSTVLGAHMLEICPSLSDEKPKIEVHDLGIGGKDAPARLIFNGKEGKAICVSLIDMGNRFRLIILDVEAIKKPHDMPNLPVANVLWKPMPSLEESAEAWIYAGGAHHTAFSYEVTAQDMIDFAELLDIEYIYINKDTKINELKRELLINDMIWKLK
ncbi:MAG: L-arabinose isomerase [Oscillospiraceae bacterium]|nr:L-arabinose isomerase [Oscillospiraceae bacterium]